MIVYRPRSPGFLLVIRSVLNLERHHICWVVIVIISHEFINIVLVRNAKYFLLLKYKA